MQDSNARPPVVMKFGGSSVADLDRMRQVAERIVARARQQPVVAVVSAMGRTTNQLLDLARGLGGPLPSRELDMLLSTGERQSMALLAIAVGAAGADAVSLTGSQCGIVTDHRHGQARVIEVRPFRILDELAAGRVVVVGGFQGVSYRRDVTTIGRGGSDTSAVALAAALGGDCEIYSDVDGVYDADPREVPGARRIDEIGYEEMQALSRAGAKVLHAQAVALAAEAGIAIYARRTDGTGGETVVRANPARSAGVRAVTSDTPVALLQLRASSDAGPPLPATWCARVGALGLLHLAIEPDRVRGLLPLTRRTDAAEVIAAFSELAHDLGGRALAASIEEDLALVSCIGTGLEELPSVWEAIHATLTEVGCPSPRAVFSESHCVGLLVPPEPRLALVRGLHARLCAASTTAPTR